jgi:hypothetical protein
MAWPAHGLRAGGRAGHAVPLTTPRLPARAARCAAECFALLPLAGLMGRTGNDNGCDLDYDASTSSVVVRASRQYR